MTREDDSELERKVRRLEEDRSRLEARLKKVVAENGRLKSANDAHVASGNDESGSGKRENAELRMQINQLAAGIVNLTTMLAGSDSEITGIVRGGEGRNGRIDRSSGIADRMRALRESALSAHRARIE